MSKLDELIAEHCPDGVEYVSLADVARISNGKDHKHLADGEIPVYGSGGIMRYANQFIYDQESVLIPRKGSIGNIFYVNTPFWTVDTIFYTKITNRILPKYLYYYLTMAHVEDLNEAGGVPSLTKTVLDKISIALPPLPVQSEIVRILDNFTELTVELTVELTAELTARKKQYEYYRDELLTFGDNVPEYGMGEVLTFLNGRAYKQPELLGSGKYPVLRVGNFYTNDSWYYSDLELSDDKYCDDGDLLYSWAATLGPKIWDGGKCIFHYHIWKILFDENLIDKKYLYYYLQYDLSQISRSITKSTMVHVSMGSMKNRGIKLPHLNEQKRIAGLIEKLDSLCTSIKVGLPAEIEARIKQYEYYRDQVLSFQKIGERHE